MRNIKLLIEYDGSRYAGWQKQKGKGKSDTIMERIENVLEKMEGEKIELIGALRTEAGVHAYQQVANFKTNSKMKLYEMKHYLNRFLPMDIAVIEVEEVEERFHSSFHAKSFQFEYKISMEDVPSVFQRKYQYYSFKKLDGLKMRDAAKILLGKHDFKAFANNKRMKKSTERWIRELDIYVGVDEMSITIQADDFWPFFARTIVGVLLQVGRGELALEQVKDLVEGKVLDVELEIAEAKGLFLQEVIY